MMRFQCCGNCSSLSKLGNINFATEEISKKQIKTEVSFESFRCVAEHAQKYGGTKQYKLQDFLQRPFSAH